MQRVQVDQRIEAIRRSRRQHGAGREDFRREFPKQFRERLNPATGKTEWKVNVENWRDGKRTKDGLKMQEMMTPLVRAESHRSADRQRPATVAMRGDGGTHYVAPHLVEDAHRSNGWREPVAGRRWRSMATVGSRLWRYGADGWALDDDSQHPAPGTITDPSGAAWRFSDCWRPI